MNKILPIALFTDLHIGDSTLDKCSDFLKFLKEELIKKEIKTLFFLGDLYDDREGISEVVLNFSIDFFEELLNIEDLKIYLIPGNHDKLIQIGEDSYLNVLPYLNKNRIRLFKTANSLIDKENKISYYFLPYFEEDKFEEQKDILVKLVSEEEGNNKKVLLSHYMYEQLPKYITQHFDKIFLGHNHERIPFPNGEYLGSCYQQNFSEDTDKGFSLLNGDLKTKLIKFEGKEYVTQTIDLNTFSEDKVKEFVLSFIKKYPNKYLRLNLEGFGKDITYLKEFCKQKGVNVVSKIDNSIDGDTPLEDLNISQLTKAELESYYLEFVKLHNISEDIDLILKEILFKDK